MPAPPAGGRTSSSWRTTRSKAATPAVPATQRAADYVAGLWRKAGLEPAFSGQFVQTVAFKTRQIDESRSSLALVRDGRVEPLSLGEDA